MLTEGARARRASFRRERGRRHARVAHSESPFWILAIHSSAAEALDVMEELHASTARQLMRSVVSGEVPLLVSYGMPGGQRSTSCAMPVCTSIWRARAIEKTFLAAVRIASRSSLFF